MPMPATANTIPCACCHGRGERTVSVEYSETLAALRRLKKATCREIADVLGVDSSKSTIILKRVSRLEEWGLVRRTGQKLPKGQTDPRKRAWVFEVC